MKTPLLVALCFAASISTILAQEINIDSLLTEIENEKGKSARALYSLALHYSKMNNHQKAVMLFEKQIERELDDDQNLYVVYSGIADFYRSLDDLPQAEEYRLLALEKAKLISDSSKIVSESISLASLYWAMLSPEKAVDILEPLNPYATDSLSKHLLYKNLGLSYSDMHRPYDALSNFYKARQYFPRSLTYYYINLSSLHNNFADAFLKAQRFDSAFHHINKSLQIDYQIKDTVGLLFDLGTLASIYAETGDHKNAVRYYRKVIDFKSKVRQTIDPGFEIQYIGMLDSLSRSYYRLKNIDSANYFSVFVRAAQSHVIKDMHMKRVEKNFQSTEQKLRAEVSRREANSNALSQYLMIAVTLTLVSIVYFALSKFDTHRRYTKFVSILLLLLFFELLLVWLDPFVSSLTNDIALYKFLVNFFIAVLIIPIHKLGENIFNKVILDIKVRKLND